MGEPGTVGRRGSRRLAAAAALLAAACAGGGDGGDEGRAAVRTTTPTTATVGRAPAVMPAIAEAAEPVRVVVPRIGVDAPVIPLGLDPAGALEVPEAPGEAGWWTGGPEPGEAGPAVIAGHVDSRDGPAVFFRLRDLRPGDPVEIARADGSHVRFVVERLEQHPKDAFPTAAVYGATGGPELRLITCGGTFDRSSGHYRDNVIAYATRA